MLPIEVEEQIIDHLHDDTVTLRACSLTCFAWLPRARLHLFRVVRLTRQRDSVRFLCALDSTSETNGGIGVGVLVRELHLPIMSLRLSGRRRGLRFALLCQIFRHLPNVDTLVLRRIDWVTMVESLRAGREDRPLQEMVTSVFPFLRLKRLYFQKMGMGTRPPQDIMQFVSAFPSLAALEFDRITGVMSHSNHHSTPLGTPPSGDLCIQELTMDTWRSSTGIVDVIMEDLLKPPMSFQLRRLKLKCGMLVTLGVAEFVRKTSETLEELQIDFQSDGVLQGLDISGHHTLKILGLSFRFFSDQMNRWSMIPELIASTQSAQLREVKLQIYDVFQWDFIDWSELTKALLSLHQRYPSATVTFTFLYPEALPDACPVVEPLCNFLGDVVKSGMRIDVVREGLVGIHGYDLHFARPEDPGWAPAERTWLSL